MEAKKRQRTSGDGDGMTVMVRPPLHSKKAIKEIEQKGSQGSGNFGGKVASEMFKPSKSQSKNPKKDSIIESSSNKGKDSYHLMN